ncbi:U3 small nucleolar RNA-associated protein 14 homolog A-like [Diadema antillarum]|uniref:U3 small nucleolar RNA-associated protein 14 homolog A-like n=1 Tax=Diadema antillarum TaxID=105358 RepID=UPI003A853118
MASVHKLLSLKADHGSESDDGDPDNDVQQTVSASEEEDDLEDDSRHSRLLDAISSMDAKKKSKVKQRSEPSMEVSEFQLNTKDAQGKGVWIHDLMGSLRNTPSHAALKKQMNIINKRKVLPTPLHQHEADKIQRKKAYEVVSKEVSKWDQVVTTNRKAEHLSFPLSQDGLGLPTTDQFVKKFKPSTPLEQEVYKVLHGSKFAERPDQELTKAEEEAIKAMSLSEARERRAELQKHRALMSYYEAKCRRQKKIKSKKFHRIQRKSKAKEEGKKIEDLMKTDPEVAQETLNKLEKSRAQERMSLKHRNTGKWAKTMIRYGRHNISARQELAQQLQKSRELTEKVADVNESEEAGRKNEEEEEDEAESIQPSLSDINNPWFTGGKVGKGDEEGEEEEEKRQEEGYIALEEVRVDRSKDNSKDDDEEEEEEDAEDAELAKDHKMLKTIQEERRKWAQGDANGSDDSEADADEDDEPSAKVKKVHPTKEKMKGKNKEKAGKAEAKKVSRKKKKKQVRVIEVGSDGEDDREGAEEGGLLDEGLERRQTEELLEEQSWLHGEEGQSTKRAAPSLSASVSADSVGSQGRREGAAASGNVDPKKIFTLKTTEMKSLAPQLVEEGDDLDGEKGRREHHMNIQQAFADDDVVGEFREEKAERVEKDKPKDIDLTLPGWGDWGGSGVLPSKRKRKRFIRKAPPQAPRRDANLPHVIINENRDKKFALHQVNNLPFPFSSTEQFERSIRAPIGGTWNTPSAVKALTKPRISTRLGTVIDPIEAEEAFKGRGAKQRQGEEKPKRTGPTPDIVFNDDSGRDGSRGAGHSKGHGRRRKRKGK